MGAATLRSVAPELFNAAFIAWLADVISKKPILTRTSAFSDSAGAGTILYKATRSSRYESRLPRFKAMAYDGAECIVLPRVLHGESNLNKENPK